ncbi:hypothetical protein GCM10023322_45450 [Rugosimonospora acidiphila]|uniref:Extradiol ring-cleavage dioxygenase LigAB LigA subunit domain-containing protein n=1 Tax=Rugosimonospora acidiphila TaxID=556531 RepID=A0ABP9S3D7_9ACTN
MSTHEVVRAIRDIQRRRMFDVFDADRPSFLTRYRLTDAEQHALLTNDYRALYDAGVHPMSVLFFSQVNGVPMPEYLRIIGAAAHRVAEFGRLGRD